MQLGGFSFKTHALAPFVRVFFAWTTSPQVSLESNADQPLLLLMMAVNVRARIGCRSPRNSPHPGPLRSPESIIVPEAVPRARTTKCPSQSQFTRAPSRETTRHRAPMAE